MGGTSFRETPLWHVARGVHEVTLPAEATRLGDLEYYISATTSGGDVVQFPATAPAVCQTVVVYPAARK
jgi:hypothetical protein